MRTLLARFGLFSLAGAAALAAGCAAERDPINRVQPNALPKSFFVGEKIADPDDDPEFRLKTFTVDSSRQQSTYSIGEFSGIERIRWEITEGMLVARRSYQELEGADLRGVPKEQWIQKAGDKAFVKAPNGTVVAAYRIVSHFDVRRAYNSSTGEEMNVVEENSSDRPWNEREYIRVDWSQNLATSTQDSMKLFGYAKVTPVEYAITDPTSEDAPHVELESGYFDVTNKFTVEPDDVQLSWGSIKQCVLESFVSGSGAYDCSPQESTMRMSFARIDPAKEDFESFEDTFAWRDVVGNWSGAGDGRNRGMPSARQTWDPAYGITDAQTKRLKAIHEIWTKSHQDATCSSTEDADKDGTADACANTTTGYSGHSGSQCDMLVGRCTIPVRDREVKTIAYHFNKEAPDALQDEADASGKVVKRGTLEDLTHAWDQMLSVAVAYRREVECRRTKDGTRESCHAEFFESDKSPAAKTMVSFGGWLVDTVKPQAVDKGKAVVTACHNPVRAYDPEVCGKPGDVARFGDIRKNFLVYWPYESSAHYGGVGANPPDPITGQSFGATATIMGRSATMAAAMQRDIVQLAMGDLSMDELVEGVPSQRFSTMLKEGRTASRGLVEAKTEADLAAAVSRVDPAHVRAETGLMALPEARAAIAETMLKAKTLRDSTSYATAIAETDALASRLKTTPFEAQLADGRWMTSVLGASPSSPVTEDMLDLASPLRGLDPARVDALHKWHGEDLAERGACFHDSTLAGPGSVYQASLAGFFKGRYKDLDAKTRGERIYDDLWREAVKGIGLHELGHSLGLRHNFASSWDAVNFQPQYWQLRTGEGKAKDACKGPRSGDDDTCMGPRYVDPMTADEQGLAGESRPGIDYFANTSTMEYSIERFGETAGLGTYDLHAMKALYGRVLEAVDDSVMPKNQQQALALKTFTQLQEKDLVRNGAKYLAHYTQTARIANVFDPQRDCRDATPEEKATAGWRIVHGKVCAPPPKDHAAWDDFKSDEIPGEGITGVKWHAKVDGGERIRWPYRYGEQYGSGGYMHSAPGDAGADVYELVQNLERRFDLSYPWSHFRRGRAGWVSLFLPQATASQYFSRLRAYHWQIATDLSRTTKAADLADDDVARPYVMAQGEAFRVLTKALLMPEPGNYASSPLRTPVGSSRPIFDLATGSGPGGLGGPFSLDVADARFIGDDFQNELGGSWDYQKYLHHAGFEVEKALAVMELVDPRPTLSTVARENYLDGRAPKISFRTDMPDAVDRLLGGVLAEDWEAVAPSVTSDAAEHAAKGIAALDLTLPQAKRPAGAMIVFPNIGYKQQLATALNAALLSRVGGDMGLVNKLRIWLDGDRAPALPTTRQVRMTDPRTGYTYVAGRFGSDVVDGKGIDRGIGSRMLQHANDLVAAAYDVKRDAQGKVLVDETGRPEVLLGTDGMPKLANADAEVNLRKYIALVDAMRQIQVVLGNGPLGGQDE